MHFRKSLFVLPVLACLFLCTPAFALESGGYIYTVSAGNEVTITKYTGPGGAVVIPSTIEGNPVVSIGSMAFESIFSLTGVTIPGSVRSIGAAAFTNCSNLTAIAVDAGNTAYSSHGGVLYNLTGTVLIAYPGGKYGAFTIPAGVTSIGSYAFACCHHVTGVNIPDSVITIGDSAFNYCTGLTGVAIPASVASIGDGAFAECLGLTDIDVDSDNTVYSSRDGVLYNAARTELIQYPCGATGSFTIPGGVTSIRDSAFADCSLTGVKIPGSITYIGTGVFQNCIALISVTMPDSITSIGEGAFSNCAALTDINIENGVTIIGKYAFENCTSLTGITIPESVSSIEEHAFYYCTGLKTIDVDSGNIVYSSKDGVLYNKSRTELILYPGGKSGGFIVPDFVTSIGAYSFAGCKNLSNVFILSRVTSIEDHAFFGCPSLTHATIGSGVATIGDSAFNGCTKLARAYFNGNAPALGAKVFDHCADGFTVYYLADAAGFTNPWYGYAAEVFTPATCPATKVLGAGNPKLAYLRAFRDSLLSRSATGRKLVAMYYANAEGINAALDRSPALMIAAGKVLGAIAPAVGGDAG